MKETMNLKITILNDNTASGLCMAEHGLSYLIDTGQEILFDTGPSEIILKNARKLGVDLNSIKTVVLSHRHCDHSNGLTYLQGFKKKLVCHPDVFRKNFRKRDGSYVGMPLPKGPVYSGFLVTESREPLKLSEGVFFLGEIPRKNDFEAKTTAFVDENGNDDFMLDDTGLAIKTEMGLIIISGCAHSGICNITEHAINLTQEERVYAVLGGFHLKDDGEQTQKTIEYLRAKGVQQVIPSHCTELPALAAFYKEWPFRQIKSGQVLRF